MPNILYINGWGYDYLADSFLIGVKKNQNNTVYELPANQFIYKNERASNSAIHGKGFTLCNVVNSSELKMYRTDIALSSIDIFIFSSIHRQSGLYLQFLPYLNKYNTIILDGEDFASIFPYNATIWRRPYLWFIPRPHKRFLYFKRELIASELNRYLYFKLLPAKLCKHIPLRSSIKEISFSIPEEKVVKAIPQKQKLFPTHIVDEEVAKQIEGSYLQYAFEKEEDYYADLQSSKFGITTKRAGWDCMRHYEIAANGAVMCFKQLEQKPERCAPHGLRDGMNCISYENYDDLMRKIEKLSNIDYNRLQENSLKWVEENTCEKLATRILKTLA